MLGSMVVIVVPVRRCRLNRSGAESFARPIQLSASLARQLSVGGRESAARVEGIHCAAPAKAARNSSSPSVRTLHHQSISGWTVVDFVGLLRL